jgi:hypothetical protein
LNGCVAQLVEHCLCKAGVAGSKPVASTRFRLENSRGFILCFFVKKKSEIRN